MCAREGEWGGGGGWDGKGEATPRCLFILSHRRAETERLRRRLAELARLTQVAWLP